MRKSKRKIAEDSQEIYSARRSILLDTHVWIWFMAEDRRLIHSKCMKEIQASRIHGQINISVISVCEIGMLEAKKRVQLPFSGVDWVHEAVNAPGISLIPLSPEIAIESTRLPGIFHGDPADHILIATARRLGFTLVTQDKAILEYGRQGYVDVFPV